MVGISVPPDGLLVQINVDLFGLQVFLDTPGAKLSAKSGLLVALQGAEEVCHLFLTSGELASIAQFSALEQNLSRKKAL